MEKLHHTKLLYFPPSRWASYAAAGAATALASVNSAEAAIHYSGPIKEVFDAPPHSTQFGSFPLTGGADIAFDFAREDNGKGEGFFDIRGPAFNDSLSQSFRGVMANDHRYPAKLAFGDVISAGSFVPGSLGPFGILARQGYPNAQWADRGTGFIGFRFDLGSGAQYGWARIKMFGAPDNHFIVLDYAWGDPWDRVKAGQTRNGAEIPLEGSLGFLALGAVGLLAWRNRRKLGRSG